MRTSFFSDLSLFVRVGMGVIAAFAPLDKDHNGYLEKEEFKDFLNNTCGLRYDFQVTHPLRPPVRPPPSYCLPRPAVCSPSHRVVYLCLRQALPCICVMCVM